jgi:hypothetical protein
VVHAVGTKPDLKTMFVRHVRLSGPPSSFHCFGEEAGEALVFAKLRETNAAPGETPIIVAMLLCFVCLTAAGASAVSLSARAHGADNATLAKRSTSCFTARLTIEYAKSME